MQYYSTSNRQKKVDFATAVLTGMADDGGLYMPDSLPRLPRAFINNLAGMTLQEMSYAVASFALQGDLPAQQLHDIVRDTLNFSIPLHYVGGSRFALELFHGPTLGFKDVGARFMARVVACLNSGSHRQANVLIATSGNAGGAVAGGFHGIEGTHVYVLYPQNQLTALQEAQFTTLGDNVTALEVNGTLDDCRSMVTEAFADHDLQSRLHLTSAKTINVARLLPQLFYYFWAYAQLAQREVDLDNVVVAVPCGNLGNLTAGVMARQMGLPIKRFVATNNSNDVFTRYIATGTYSPKPSVPTVAHAMDIANPRNFKRLQAMLPTHHDMSKLIHARSYSDDDIVQGIARAWRDEHYLLDPHSATAYLGLLDDLQPGEVGLSLATAHPAKYAYEVESAIGEAIAMPPELSRHLSGRRHVVHLNSGYNSLRNYLADKL